jgi:hypothetical protein
MDGELMGANIIKGHTHRWLLNHILDGVEDKAIAHVPLGVRLYRSGCGSA